MMNPPEWTDSENATLRHLVEIGLDDPAIGARLGKTARAVRARRSRMHISRGTQQALLWKTAEDDRLTELWAVKMPTVEMAATLTVEFGRLFTKNAIIGRAHRLALLSRKASPQGRKPRVRGYKLAPRVSRTRPAPAPPAEDHAWKLFSELQGEDCRFVQGEPMGSGTLMCGLPTMVESYCPYHHWMTHQKPHPAR